MTLLLHCLAGSHDKLKVLYLHYHNANPHQTWQVDRLNTLHFICHVTN